MKELSIYLRDLLFLASILAVLLSISQALGASYAFGINLVAYFTFQDYLKMLKILPLITLIILVLPALMGIAEAKRRGRNIWDSIETLQANTLGKIIIPILTIIAFVGWYILHDTGFIIYFGVLIALCYLLFIPRIRTILKTADHLPTTGYRVALVLPLVIIFMFFKGWFDMVTLTTRHEIKKKSDITTIILSAPRTDTVQAYLVYPLDKYLVVWEPQDKQLLFLPQSNVIRIITSY